MLVSSQVKPKDTDNDGVPDSVDEDDDNDYNDDDCNDCTTSDLEAILSNCANWTVDELELNDNDLENK